MISVEGRNAGAIANVSANSGKLSTMTQAADCQWCSARPARPSQLNARVAPGMNSSVKLCSTSRFSSAAGTTARMPATADSPPALMSATVVTPVSVIDTTSVLISGSEKPSSGRHGTRH